MQPGNTPSVKKQLALVILKRMEELNLSQAEMISDTGLCKRTVQRILNGKSNIRIENLELIADFLDCAIAVSKGKVMIIPN